ncbi:hypothetical protein F4779DRAFT_628283 [Xylariaceae sp. FL0662B]|nr:hypothetical protein F4779DRAFT_628283 [Xylariaceae sp. FL0662B]
MASSQYTSRTILARDIVAYSDAELDRYLEERRFDDGAVDINVEDPENLSPSFIQRLRDRAERPGSPDQSRPVDADQLTSRLLDISSGWDTSLRRRYEDSEGYSSGATTPTVLPPEVRERKCYNELVREGGRPVCSIDLFDEVVQHPLSHWDMLRPWVQYSPDLDPDPEEADGLEWGAFYEQMWDWRKFRKWQRYIRKDYIGFDSTYAYVRGEGRAFSDYNEAVRILRAEYDFTRPFQLHKDPMEQDKLATWIEYLGYQCWVHYRCTQRIKGMQPAYDIAWKKLVDSNVLRPFETEEYVQNTYECGKRHQSDRYEATKAAESAERATKAVVASMYNDAHNPKGARLTSQQRMQRMLAAKSRLEAAKESLTLVKRRNDLVAEFRQAIGPLGVGAEGYVTAKRDAKRYSLRIRWILDQVPLIEAESNGSSVAETGLDTVRGTKRRLSRDADDEAAHDRDIKKQRQDAGTSGPLLACEAGPGYQGGKPKRGREDTADDGLPSKRVRNGSRHLDSTVGIFDSANAGLTEDLQKSKTPTIRRGSGKERASKPSSDHLQRRRRTKNTRPSSTTIQPLRRSARIAARQETAQTVMTRSGAAKSPSRRSRRRMAQSRTSTANALLARQHSRAEPESLLVPTASISTLARHN